MILRFFKISGHSMLPNLAPRDHVLTSSIPYLFSKPKVGDVVVFKTSNTSPVMIKRVSKISNNKLFVKGDNQKDSLDPGFLSKKDIIGKVLFKI